MKQIILIAFIAIATMMSCDKSDDDNIQLISAEDYVGRWQDVETTNDDLYMVISLDDIYYRTPDGQLTIRFTDVVVSDDGIYYTLGTSGGSSWVDFEGELNLTLDVLTVKIVYAVNKGAIIDPSIYPHLIYKRLNK